MGIFKKNKREEESQTHIHFFTTRYHLVSVHFHQVWHIFRKILRLARSRIHLFHPPWMVMCIAKNPFKRVTFRIVLKWELVNIWHHKSLSAPTPSFFSPLLTLTFLECVQCKLYSIFVSSRISIPFRRASN